MYNRLYRLASLFQYFIVLLSHIILFLYQCCHMILAGNH